MVKEEGGYKTSKQAEEATENYNRDGCTVSLACAVLT